MTEPSPTQGPSRARRVWIWVRRALVLLLNGVLLAVLCAIALVGGWVQSKDFEARAISVAEGLVDENTGEVCSIDELDVRFWPPALEVAGFHLNNAETGDVIVRVDRARAPLVLRDGGVGLGRVTVDGPFAWLRIGEDGKLKEFSRLPRRDPNRATKPITRLPWSSLQVTDGAFRFTFPKGQLDLSDLDLVPTRGAFTDLTADLRVQVNDLDETGRFDIADIELGPDVVDIPPFEFRSNPLILNGEGRFPLQGEMDALVQLHVPLEEINEALIEPRRAHGEVYADLRIEGQPSDPTVRLTALAERFELDLPGVFTPLLNYEVGDITTSIVARKETIDIENLTVSLASGTLEAWGEVTTSDLRLRRSRVVGSEIMLRELLMAFDAAPTPWVNMTTDLEVAWEGTLNPLRLEGHFDMDVASLKVGNMPIAHPDVSLMLDIPAAYAKGTILLEKDRVYLAAPTVVGPRTRGSCTIDIGFGPRGPLDLQADLTSVNMNDFQPLNGVEMSGVGRIVGRIWGPFNQLQMRGSGDIKDFSVMDIEYADHLTAVLVSPDMKSIELHDARARKGSTQYGGWYKFDFKPPMGMYTDVSWKDGRIEDIVGIFIDLPGMTGNMSGELSLHGPLYNIDGGSHIEMTDIDLWGETFDTGEGHGFMDDGLFTMDTLRVERNGGREGLVMRGSVERDWALNMEIFGDGLALERMTRLEGYDLPLTGNIALQAHITNTLFDPSPDGRIAITDVRYNGYPIEDSHLVFNSTEGVAHYGAVIFGGAAEADGTLGLWGLQPYDIDIAMRDLPVHLLYPKGANGNPIRATTTGNMSLSGHFGEVWSPVTLRSKLDEVEVRYLDHTLTNKTPWLYAQNGNSWQIEDFGLVGSGTDFQISATGGDSLVLAGEGTVDLSLLKAAVPGLEKARGYADIQLFAEGSAPNVEAVAEIDMSADLLRHSSVPASFEDMVARMRLTDDLFTIEDVVGNIGGGTIQGGGTIDAESWVPSRYDLGAEVRDAQIQWVDSLPAAIGDASLAFDGPVDAALLSGQVTVNDMPFSDRIDWEDWVVEYRDEMLVDPATVYEDEEQPYFAMNVEITADRTIRLRNNVADGTASTEGLRIIGDTSRPGLVGSVVIEEGLAYIQDREFVVDRGEINFNDPWTWDPDVDFDLMTDIENLDQRYRVNYLVFGPFSDWRTETRSDPQLPQADVNALLWFGATTEQLADSGEQISAVAQGVADMVLTDFLLANTSGDLGGASELLQVDRVDLATGVNARGEYSSEPRLLVEWSGVEALGDIDVRWEQNVVRPDDIFFTVERPFGVAWSLAGWYATRQRDRVLPIGGAYGVDIRWRGESD